MKISKIKIKNFRNIEEISFSPTNQVNVIFGENAQGKTNLIEAIWLLSGNASFRGAKTADLLKIGAQKGTIHADFCDHVRDYAVSLSYGAEKKMLLNGMELKSSNELSGNFYAVVFSPVDLSLIKDGPKNRRKFIDLAICAMNPQYKNYLSVYERLLEQRNALLKNAYQYQNLKENIDIWDMQLAKAGTILSIYRGDYVKKLSVAAKKQYSGLCSNQEVFALSYASTVFPNMDTVTVYDDCALKTYQAALKESFETDLKQGFTTVGIHRDDIEIQINSLSARVYGSQGQQRSSVIALKLAEAELIKKVTNEAPVMLLDDVMSELDEKRQDYILNHIENMQVFITCCEKDALKKLKKGKFFKMESGSLLDSGA